MSTFKIKKNGKFKEVQRSADIVIGTHDGFHHLDELMGIMFYAWSQKKGLVFKVIRSRDPEVLKQCNVLIDVGGIYDIEAEKFDHHQESYDGDLSSAGMVFNACFVANTNNWKHWTEADDGMVVSVLKPIVSEVDECDNHGGYPETSMSHFVAHLEFAEALDIVNIWLRNIMKSCCNFSYVVERGVVKADNLLPKNLEYIWTIFPSTVIYDKTNSGVFSFRAPPGKKFSMDVEPEELIFIHKTGFMFKSKGWVNPVVYLVDK